MRLGRQRPASPSATNTADEPTAAESQRYGPADEEPVELEDPLDRRRVDRGVGGQCHHRRLPIGLRADRRRDDVDALLAEDRAHPADHPGLIRVAEDRQVFREGQVEVPFQTRARYGMLRGPTPVPATSTASPPLCRRTTTSSVKSSETASRVSSNSIPRSSAMCGPLTRLTGSSV